MTPRPVPAPTPTPTRLFSLTTGADTGGWAGRVKDAFDRHPPRAPGLAPSAVTFRAMVNNTNYIGYPYDHTYDQALLEDLYDWADVVTLHNTLHGHDFYDGGRGKPTAIVHHGAVFRDSLEVIRRQARAIGAIQTCSTIDLERKDVVWLPIPYELDGPISSLAHGGEPRSFADLRAAYHPHPAPSGVQSGRSPTRTDGPVVIAHAPTDRAVKSTEAFLAAISQLKSEGLPVQGLLIEGQPWRRCLELKAGADILVDQLILGYGCNAIEAWALGMPVVAATTDPAVRARMLDRWGRLPFVEATEASLASVLRTLVIHREARAEAAAIGTAHVRTWHNSATAVARTLDFYRTARPTKPGAGTRRQPKLSPALKSQLAAKFPVRS